MILVILLIIFIALMIYSLKKNYIFCAIMSLTAVSVILIIIGTLRADIRSLEQHAFLQGVLNVGVTRVEIAKDIVSFNLKLENTQRNHKSVWVNWISKSELQEIKPL